MKTPDVQAVDRLLHRPVAAVRAGRRLTQGALDNARRSFEEISRSVDERQVLQRTLTDAHAPGDLGALDETACRELLASRSFGRLAYVARAGVPDIVPVNYVVSGDHLLIRSGSGPKLQAAQRGETVAFEVDQVDDEQRSGWSVVVVGRLSVVDRSARLTGEPPEPWAKGPRPHLVRLDLARVTGRRLVGWPGS